MLQMQEQRCLQCQQMRLSVSLWFRLLGVRLQLLAATTLTMPRAHSHLFLAQVQRATLCLVTKVQSFRFLCVRSLVHHRQRWAQAPKQHPRVTRVVVKVLANDVTRFLRPP